MAETFINRKNKMAMGTADQLKRHFCGSVNAVLVTAGRTKFRMAAERNKFKFTATRASIHGTAKGRIPTIYHLLNIFHNNRTRMENILNFLIMFFKNLLQYIHRTIMQEKKEKRKPLIPLMNEGLGELRCRRHFLVLGHSIVGCLFQ